MTRALVTFLSAGGLVLVACTGSSGKAGVDGAPVRADTAVAADQGLQPRDAPGTDPSDSRTADGPSKAEAMPPDTTAGTDTQMTDTPPAADTPAPKDASLTEALPNDAPRDAGNSTKPITFSAWPGGNAVANASVKNAFGPNLSGLIYQPAAGAAPAILWAVQNEPAKVYRLTWNGTAFVPATSEGWADGKTLTFPNGSGGPDSEGLTRTEWDGHELYVSTEKNNDVMSTPRLSILRYDLAGTSTTLKATHEWNLSSDLPKATDANKGLEGIAWIPDSYLVARGFYDEARKAPYDPSSYADHGTGIFLVGVEDTGMLYGFALDHSTGAFKRVATFSSGQEGVMDLAFDRDTGTLWSACDGLCKNHITLLDIDTSEGSASKGHFIVRASLPPPSTLTSTNNEGITLAPESECANSRRGFFWSDDDESKGIAIRRDSIPCGRLF